MPAEETTHRVPIRDLVRYYLRLGVLGFGGPVALVGQMERELVAEKKWLTKEEMREGIAVCQSLPGPLAIQVGIWISYIRGGFWGEGAGAGGRRVPQPAAPPPRVSGRHPDLVHSRRVLGRVGGRLGVHPAELR